MCAVKKLCSLGGQQWGKVELQSPREPAASVAETRISHGRRNDLSISPFRPVMCAIQNTPNMVAHFLLPWTKRAKVKRQAGQSFFFFLPPKVIAPPLSLSLALKSKTFPRFSVGHGFGFRRGYHPTRPISRKVTNVRLSRCRFAVMPDAMTHWALRLSPTIYSYCDVSPKCTENNYKFSISITILRGAI